jgi:hypothetical protein
VRKYRDVMSNQMVSGAIAVFAISCAPPASAVENNRPPLQLARFMREEVSVPFSFVMLETATARRGRRVHRAATVLREAARDLAHWSDPPVASDEGRDVFYAYAENLELHVARLEEAAAHHEPQATADTVEEIRQTCNHCHRFFRPTSFISPDVAYDSGELDLGGIQ